MGNNYFEFQQFMVRQEYAGMKVSTDACIQGAYYTNYLIQNKIIPERILDIGTGTGLLTLMMAQKFGNSNFYAIDMDSNAIKDASFNFQNSPWKNNIEYNCEDLLTLDKTKKFDAIICNPPFFSNQLLTIKSNERLFARHDITLTKKDLASSLQLHLNGKSNSACIIFPTSEWEEWMEQARNHSLHLIELIHIRPNGRKYYNRTIGIFSTIKNSEFVIKELTIYDSNHNYTDDFKQLLNSYYLCFG